MSKKLILLFAIFLLLAAAVACPAPPAPGLPKEIRIGVVMSITGPLAAMGSNMRDAAKLAAKEINAAGGIAGKRVTVLVEDDATDPATSLSVIKKLVEVGGVKVIVGPMISGAVMASGPYVAERSVLLVSPSATSPLITVQPWTHWAFRTAPSDTFQGAAMAKIIIDKGFKKVAILVMDNPYGIGIETVAKDALKGKAEIVASIRYDPKKLDYLTELGIIKDKKSDVVLHVGYHDDGNIVYKQALVLGLDAIPWVVAEGVHGMPLDKFPEAAKFMNKAVTGTTVAVPEDLPAFMKFRDAYTAEYKISPTVYTDTTYDAVKLVALAIKEAGVYDGAKIRDALWKVGKKYSGASGAITFDDKGDRVAASYGIWKVELVAGKYQFKTVGFITF